MTFEKVMHARKPAVTSTGVTLLDVCIPRSLLAATNYVDDSGLCCICQCVSCCAYDVSRALLRPLVCRDCTLLNTNHRQFVEGQ